MAYRLDPAQHHRDHDSEQRRLRLRRRLARKRSIALLPTMCTLGNALCGFLAIFFASRPPDTEMLWNWTPLTFAAVFIFVGMLMDALDGRLARMTNNTSTFGEQLDSMADMVTFGAAPAFLAVQLIGLETPFASARRDYIFDRIALVIAGIYVACAALRLARFNIQTRLTENADHMSFLGLPSPGAAGTVASLILLHQHYLADYWRRQAIDPQVLEPIALRLCAIGMVITTLVVALMMVSRFRYTHVMNRYFRGRARFGVVVRVVILVALASIRPREVFAGAFVVYALSAPAVWFWRVVVQRQSTTHSVITPRAAELEPRRREVG